MPKSKTAATPYSKPVNPSLIALTPRQVLLANPTLNMKQTIKPDHKKRLLHYVAQFLERHGFSKTLKKFLKEAKIEKEVLQDISINLEEMYSKYLETCNEVCKNVNNKMEQDSQLSKKNKKKSGESDSHITEKQSEAACDLDDPKDSKSLANNTLPNANGKSVEKKKKKKTSEPIGQGEDNIEAPADYILTTQTDDTDKKGKEKRKKSKHVSEPAGDNVEQHLAQSHHGKTGEKSKDIVSCDGKGMTDCDIEKEFKDKKNKKSKLNGARDTQSSKLDGSSKSKNVDESIYVEGVAQKENKKSKKRKNLASEENGSKPVGESKHRKTEDVEVSDGAEQAVKKSASVASEQHSCKEIKGENDQVGGETPEKTPVMELSSQEGSKLQGQKSASKKTIKKQHENSSEPRTVNAFQRVKVDEVEFVDERLQDNSYWAKHGSESGYGAKAQEILGQVRGRDFRHEKTKKKRGSYRGGQIDLQSHSVKFDYSDEDQ